MPLRRVLLVEDEFVVALNMEDVLRAAGYRVMGPSATVGAALSRLREETPDAAVLDVNLGGERVFPVADVLAARRIPFVFVTGYERPDLPAAHSARPVLNKPCQPRALLARLAAVLGDGD